MKVRVLRPICIKAVRQEPGTVVDLPDHQAREALWMGKVEAVIEKVTAKTEPVTVADKKPMTTKSAGALLGKGD